MWWHWDGHAHAANATTISTIAAGGDAASAVAAASESPASDMNMVMGACRNSFFGVFGIFLAKKSSPSSKFQRGNIFTWPTFSHFVIHLE